MKTIKITAILFIAVSVIVVMLAGCDSNAKPYKEAEALLNNGKYAEAADAFEALGNYEDSAGRAKEAKGLIKYILAINISEFTWTDESGNTFDCPTDGNLWFENADFISANRNVEYGIKSVATKDGRSVNVTDYDTILNDTLDIVFSVDNKKYTFAVKDGMKFAVNKTESGGYALLPDDTLEINR